ncbi:MAG: hypothetical protein ABW321_00790 [Polyangiales bacterium]
MTEQNTRERRRMAVWLLPGEPERTRLLSTITELARQQGAPSFVPHVTLLSGVGELEEWQAKLGSLMPQLSRVTARVSGVGHSERLFKTLYLQLEAADALCTLQRQVAQLLGQDYVFDPHLSLLYRAALPISEREALAATVARPPQLCGTSLALAYPAHDHWEAIARWTVIPLGELALTPEIHLR